MRQAWKHGQEWKCYINREMCSRSCKMDNVKSDNRLIKKDETKEFQSCLELRDETMRVLSCILWYITDDSVKVVKPKDLSAARGLGQSPAASSIQSPKPNNPGFLLGTGGGGKAFRAFSPYTGSGSRSGRLQYSEYWNSMEGINLLIPMWNV